MRRQTGGRWHSAISIDTFLPVQSIISMATIAHFTDPHLPLTGASPRELASKRILGWLSWRLRRRHNHHADVLTRITDDIMACSPDVLALTGDVVNIATRSEFAATRHWLERLAPPERLMLVPGNHDFYVRDALKAGLPRLAPWMTGRPEERMPEFPTVRYVGNVALIGVDSTWPAPWREASGMVGEEQLERLRHLLANSAAKGFCRIVLIHHPPLAELASKPRKALKDADRLHAVLVEQGAEAVLYGHNHEWAHRPLETRTGIAHILSAPSASMAPGRRKPPAGWQLLEVERRRGEWVIDVTRRALASDGKEMQEPERLFLSSLSQ